MPQIVDVDPAAEGVFDDQKTLDKYLNKVGGFGCYQAFSILTVACGFSGMNFIVYHFSYYELFPKYLCTYKNDPTQEVACKPEQFCDDPNVLSWKIDYSNPESLHNWIEKLNLTCGGGKTIGTLGSVLFIGWVITLLILPRIADVFGRMPVWRIGLVV